MALVEREAFPRFKVGESLIPTCMDICKRMGVLDRVLAHGFQVKYGATFHDQELGLETTFDFRPGRPWPSFTLDVHRAEFDQILLEHAASQPGVTVHQPATVEKVVFDGEGVTARLSDHAGERELRASFLVDASGRDAFLAARQGQRKPRPGLGKVAIFAYFRGARRFPGRSEGNVRLYIFPEGWFWYIPLARDETSVGCVLHQRVVKAPARHAAGAVRRDGAALRADRGEPRRGGAGHRALHHLELRLHHRADHRRPVPLRGRRGVLRGPDLLARGLPGHADRRDGRRCGRARVPPRTLRGPALSWLRAGGAPRHQALRALHRVVLRPGFSRRIHAAQECPRDHRRGDRSAGGRLVRAAAEASLRLALVLPPGGAAPRWQNLRRGVVLESRLDW